MQFTRREIVDDILGYVGEPGDADARVIANRVCQRAIESIWQKRAWRAFVSPSPLELTLTASTRSYALPDVFGRPGPGKVRNLTQGGAEVTPITLDRLQELYPSAGTTLEGAGYPLHYLIAGTVGVQSQPASTGEALEVVSNSASDLAVVVTLGGDLSGHWQTVQVTLTGTSPVAVGTWTYVDVFGKAYPDGTDAATDQTSSVGTVSLRKVTGGTVLQSLLPQESQRQHQVITFYPKPVSADVIAIPFIRGVNRLWHDSDPLPDGWGNAVFEESVIQWRINTGEMGLDTANTSPRPALIDLVSLENAVAPRKWGRPFQG